MNKKQAKHLMSIYRRCINAMEFNKNTKHYRNMLNAKIKDLSKKNDISIPIRCI